MKRLLALLFVLSATAHAQFEAPPVISSSGVEYHQVVPTEIEFGLYFIARKDTLAESMAAVGISLEQLNEALKGSELEPSTMETRAPLIKDIHNPAVTAYVSLTYGAGIIPDEDNRLTAFGDLCDRINALAKRLNATATGPMFAVRDPESHERTAVQSATENALYQSEGIAELMNTAIYEVEKVNVNLVEWIQQSDDPKLYPTLDRITCKAEVTVTYRHRP